MVRENQVRVDAGVVDEAAEADNERHVSKPFAHLPGLRRPKHRIDVVDQQHFGRKILEGLDTGCEGLESPREEDSAGLAIAAEQPVQCIDGERREQPVGLRQRRPSYDGHRRTELDELARQALEALWRDTGDLSDAIRRVVRETARPPVNQTSAASRRGRPQLLLQNHVGETKRQHTVGPWLDRHPFVSAGAGERHPRFHLHEVPAYARTGLPHPSVRGVLCHR